MAVGHRLSGASGMPSPPGSGSPAALRPVSGGTLRRLVQCERRMWLDAHAPGLARPRGVYDELLVRRGVDLEREVALRTIGILGPFVGPGLSFDDGVRETTQLLRESRRPIYQAALRSADGLRVGVPDFVMRDGESLVVRDVKLALRPERRPEVALQLTHYAELTEESSGRCVARLEVVNGAGETLEVPRVPRERYLAAVARARALLDDPVEPGTLLAHSTCEGCPFYAHCWSRAESERRIEVLPEVWRSRAQVLHAEGVHTIEQLAACDPGELRHPALARVAPRMIAEARAHALGDAVWLAPPRLPAGRTLVWLDLEGDAMGEGSRVPIYLWGLAVERGPATTPEPLFADLEPGGDRRGWMRFVARALEIHARHPDALWVHWHEYEPTWIRRYVRRLGAPVEFAQALLRPGATFDLHRVVDHSVRLPLRSYSIKKVAPWIGFRWSNSESGSEWSVAQFHRACHAADAEERDAALAEIARYNADDLWAMRAIWRWLEAEGPAAPAGS